MSYVFEGDPYVQPNNVFTGIDGRTYAMLPNGGEVALTEVQKCTIDAIARGEAPTYAQTIVSAFAVRSALAIPATDC